MLDIDRVFTHFTTMSGLDEGGAAPYRALCDGAARYIFSSLREDVHLAGQMDRLCLAAAALAYGDWIELGGSLSAAEEMRVGEITLRESRGNAPPRGGALREHFLAGIADLLAPRFVLAGVPGGRRDVPAEGQS